MGFESYISESEAATLAGVGVTTLRRFAEAGYFKIETEADGLRLYARSDLEKVFGVKAKVVPVSAPQVFPNWTPPKASISPESNGAPVVDVVETKTEDKPVEVISAPEQPVADPVVMASLSQPQNVDPTPPTPQTQLPQTQLAQPSSSEMLEREVQKLRVISDMQDRLLQIRESEISSLKEEREWLRTRVEKLEEKSSRDQVLLLSETQTIKTLITIQEQRRSPVRLALEWLGFVTPAPIETNSPRSAIDVTHASNETAAFSTENKKAA